MNKLIFPLLFLTLLCVLALYVARVPPLDAQRHVVHHALDKQQLRLLAIGDFGTGNASQFAVAEMLETLCQKYTTDAILFLGDNFYESGVQNVADPQWESKFRKVYKSPCLSDKKIYAVLGNHDYQGNARAQIEYSKSDAQWNMPARVYAVQFGTLLKLVALDTTLPDKCFLSLCSLDWAQAELARGNFRWKGAFGHHPVFRIGNSSEPNWFLRKFVPQMLCSRGAQFYFAGHLHNLQHLVDTETGCRVHHFISGAGGAELESVQADKRQKFAAAEHGVLMATFSESEADFRFYASSSGEPVYQNTFTAQ